MPESITVAALSISDDLELEKKRLEIEKLRIETSKLQLEQSELEKAWFRKPQWWSALFPFIIGIATVLIAFLTGIISIERLKNEKEDLAKSINLQKDSIAFFSRYVKAQRDSLTQLVDFEKQNILRLQYLKDSLINSNRNQRNIIHLNNKEKLDRIDREIHMYADHDSIYKQFDEAVGDTISKGLRAKKLIELRKARAEILRQLKSKPKTAY